MANPDEAIDNADKLNTVASEIGKNLSNKKDTFRIKKGDKIDFKIYSTGWTGGSRAKIKTYKFSDVGKAMGSVTGQISKKINAFNYMKAFDKRGIYGVARQFVENKIGEQGAAKGALLCAKAFSSITANPVWKVYLGIAGAAIGAFLGSKFGGELASKAFDWIEEKFELGPDNADGVLGLNSRKSILIRNNDQNGGGPGGNYTGKGKTGGIEFEIPKPIKNFSKTLFFQKNHQIIINSFHSNKEEILDISNRFITQGNYKFTSVNQVFQTILTEIYIGFKGEGILPYVSLNFNKSSLLYSIMPKYYKKTLTGNIIGFLDYFLKGFINGGFFNEKFVNNWYKSKNIDINHLNANFTNLKKYIFKNKSKIEQHSLYLTIYDLGENIPDDAKNIINNNTLTAFRIIGTIENELICLNNNIIFPQCSFKTENDFYLFPEIEKVLIDNNKDIEKMEESFTKMKLIIKMLMPQIPYFRGYFSILNMITFAIHYIPTLDSISLYPDLSNSLIFKTKTQDNISLLPPVFPPLPIRKQIKYKINLTFSGIIKILSNEEKQKLNNIISGQILNKDNVNLQEYDNILKIVKIKYLHHLENYIKKEELEYRNESE